MVMTVLCIEDEADLREDLELELRECGCDVIAVDNSSDGLAQCADLHFDAIFCDMRMPGINGLQVLEQLRSLPGPSRHSPFVLLTAFDDPSLRAHCEASLFAWYILKPLDYAFLPALLERLNQH